MLKRWCFIIVATIILLQGVLLTVGDVYMMREGVEGRDLCS